MATAAAELYDPLGQLKVAIPKAKTKHSSAQLDKFAHQVQKDGHCIIPNILPADKLKLWNKAFLPMLEKHDREQGHLPNRGPKRYYITLPFVPPFADPEIFENADILAVVERLVGEHFTMCQLATDTPMKGSDYQDLHKDADSLFPEWPTHSPAFQLAVNFPLVDINAENGPLELAPGTHLMSKDEALRRINAGEIPVLPLHMKLGDVLFRDVRHVHRGTPNKTDIPRPMVVIGYSRRWLFRPEVSVRIPEAEWEKLSVRAKHMLRFNPRFKTVEEAISNREIYQSFAF